jgi:hypothetical protein
MRRILLLLVLAAGPAGCTGVNYGAAVSVGPDGTALSPYISGSSGNAQFSLGL